MSSQLAKMYLRGSLVTKTLRELTPDQTREIDDIIESIIREPMLQQCRYQFKRALATTIKNEYSGRSGEEAAEQEYRIAIMRAAVAAKYGWNDNEPAKEALCDEIQKKKWFQTWAFNYLRQILRENKIPSIKYLSKVTLGVDAATLYLVNKTVTEVIEDEKDVDHRRLLRSLWENADTKETDNGYKICFNYWSFPIRLNDDIKELQTSYLKTRTGETVRLDAYISLTQTVEGICIERVGPDIDVEVAQRKADPIRETSFDGKDDDADESRRDMLEAQVMPKEDPNASIVDEDDILVKLRNSVPEAAIKVLDIYMEDTRPDSFIKKYGPNTPKIVHIAEFLDISPKEVKNLLITIKHHCMILGIGRP
jgi:hypothetical protein